MYYLYHWVPDNMKGDVLYPLNVLKNIDTDIYAAAASKYEGREKLMEYVIPDLNCLWNDVIHLSAVHPSEIKKALTEAGRKKIFSRQYFEIDPHLLDPQNTVVYLYKNSNVLKKTMEGNYEKFDPDTLKKHSVIPQETKEYYKQSLSEGKNPLLYHRIPHILYKGTIDISKARKINP